MVKCNFKGCKKKLPAALQCIFCKCSSQFCSLHRLPENHNCTYNFKITEPDKNELAMNMKCVPDKIITI